MHQNWFQYQLLKQTSIAVNLGENYLPIVFYFKNFKFQYFFVAFVFW